MEWAGKSRSHTYIYVRGSLRSLFLFSDILLNREAVTKFLSFQIKEV